MPHFRIPYLITGLTTVFIIATLWKLAVRSEHSSIIESPPQSLFDIVLAHYKEESEVVRTQIATLKAIPSIAKLNPRVIVYTKGSTASPEEFDELKVLRTELGADIIRTLPNEGRETHTFLSHIVDHWNDLADHTLFAQANFHSFDIVQSRLKTHFNTSVGVMSLHNHDSCHCDKCMPRWGGPEEGYKRIPELYIIFNEQLCPPKGVLMTYRGQFIVSRERVYHNSREKFKWLLGVLRDMSHFVHDDYPGDVSWHDFAKDVSNPELGHAVERAWLFMFGCNDVAIAKQCPDMVVLDETKKCACYDN